RVDDEHRRHVRRLAELLDVDPIGPRNELPVDVLQIVALLVVTVLAELRAVAVKGTAMQTRHQPVNDNPRDKLEIRDVRQNIGRTCVGHTIRSASPLASVTSYQS